MQNEMYETTLNRSSKAALMPSRGAAATPEPRFVRETSGHRRVASSVQLDKNIPRELAAPQEMQSASHRSHEWPGQMPPQKPRHERPQKNFSTFLKPSGAVAEGVRGTFATFTSHEKINVI
jgi:hypothetical protein